MPLRLWPRGSWTTWAAVYRCWPRHSSFSVTGCPHSERMAVSAWAGRRRSRDTFSPHTPSQPDLTRRRVVVMMPGSHRHGNGVGAVGRRLAFATGTKLFTHGFHRLQDSLVHVLSHDRVVDLHPELTGPSHRRPPDFDEEEIFRVTAPSDVHQLQNDRRGV